MSFVKFAVTAAALAGSAIAQSCSASATTTIQSPADATGLSGCQTFTGGVAIATDATGQFDFGSLGAIKGDFKAQSPNVTAIMANSLKSMGAFTLTNMSQLYTLSMDQLRTVDSIDWNALQTLQQPKFGTGLEQVNSKISVQNTMIQDLSSLNIREIQGDVVIANNPALTALAWDTTNMTSFIANGNGIQDQKLNLTLTKLAAVTNGFSVSNCSNVDVGSLGTVGGLLSVRSSSMESLLFPNLTTAQQGVEISNNPSLNNVSFPIFNGTMGGSIKLVNNDKLGGNLSFPALVQLRGALNITGAFDSVTMPKINTISGTCYLWSTNDIDSTCQQFSKYKSSNVIQGDLPAGPAVSGGITCHSNSKTATEQGGTGSNTNSGSGSSSTTSKNAAPGNWVATPGTVFGATGLVAAMLGMF